MEKKLCPFRRTKKTNDGGVSKTVNTRFDECYGEQCMAYLNGICRLFAPAVNQADLELMRLKNRLADLGMS